LTGYPHNPTLLYAYARQSPHPNMLIAERVAENALAGPRANGVSRSCDLRGRGNIRPGPVRRRVSRWARTREKNGGCVHSQPLKTIILAFAT